MRKRIIILAVVMILSAAMSSCLSARRADEEAKDATSNPEVSVSSGNSEKQANDGTSQAVEGGKQYAAVEAEEMPCPLPEYDRYFANAEEYGEFAESPFYYAGEVPLSTFSIDVDTASYANVRRFLNDGYLPDPDAVRVEECINYFDYSYDEPKWNEPYSIYAEMSECPWDEENYLLMVGIQAKELDRRELEPSNLVFLIDVSGSMSDYDKLPLLQSGFKMLVDSLNDEDTISIVTYASGVNVIAEGISGSEKSRLKREIDNLHAGGSTAGEAAMETAYDIAGEYFIKGGNNRIIMATDGDFNVGISSEDELERFIEKKRGEGIFLSMLGFGTGNVKDSKMELLADKGNGNYSYIDSAQEANKVLVEEMAATMYTLAKDVKVQIEFNPANVVAYRLIGYDYRRLNDEDFNDDTKDAGEMGLGQSVTVLYEIVPQGASPKVDPLRYGNNDDNTQTYEEPMDYEWLYIKTKYKHPDKDTSEENIERAVTDDDINMKPSDDFLFASAVAEFAMLLKDSEYCAGDMDDAVARAKQGRGEDEAGYRSEFIRLAQIAESLMN